MTCPCLSAVGRPFELTFLKGAGAMYLVSYVLKSEIGCRVGAFCGAPSEGGALAGLPGDGGDYYILDLDAYGRAVGKKVPAFMLEVLMQKNLELVKELFSEFQNACEKDPEAAERFVVPCTEIHLLPPVPNPGKIILIGKNYRDHCKEGSASVPSSPVIFSKFPTSLNPAGGRIVLPVASEKVDFEAELACVIGRGGRNIPEHTALEHVAGYMPLNDVSARDLQFSDGQWVRAKSCDTFCPCGPALATSDEVGDPQTLSIKLILNGEVMQDADTSQMIFSVSQLISFISNVITLTRGDIIATGTPSGVGVFREPPVLLREGDDVKVVIEKLGVLQNPVVAEEGRVAGDAGESMTRVFD